MEQRGKRTTLESNVFARFLIVVNKKTYKMHSGLLPIHIAKEKEI